MFVCLKTGLIPLEEVDETGRFLIEIMPLMFIPAAVGLLEAWNIIQSVWLQYLAVTAVSTVFVMAIAGRATQYMIRSFYHDTDYRFCSTLADKDTSLITKFCCYIVNCLYNLRILACCLLICHTDILKKLWIDLYRLCQSGKAHFLLQNYFHDHK